MKKILGICAALALMVSVAQVNAEQAGQKVTLCHYGVTIEVSTAALNGHILHNCPMGACDDCNCTNPGGNEAGSGNANTDNNGKNGDGGMGGMGPG